MYPAAMDALSASTHAFGRRFGSGKLAGGKPALHSIRKDGQAGL